MTDSMFGGGGLGYGSPLTSLFLRNPEMAAAYRRQQYAEALGQAGMSGEPIRSPWQGVNKLAQAGIAAMLMNRSDEEMTAAAQKQREQEAAQEAQGTEFMNRALGLINPQGGGSPMSQALLNPNGPPQQPPQAQPQQPQGPGQVTQIPDALLPHFQRASAETNIPIPVLAAVARQESGFRPNAVGDDGKSTGTMQVQARTARDPGFGVAPIDPAKLNDPGENIMFGARYLAGRAKAAGVTDWYDPAQRALALKAYNGGGDPNYVNHVERFIPGTGGQPAGDAGGDPSMPTPPIPPGTPQAPGAPQPAGPQGAPTQAQYAAIEADIKAGRNLQALATAGGASANPTIRKNAENMRVIGTQMENRAIAERNRLDTLANRTVQHTVAQGPDGKNYIYEVTPSGLGRQLGMAPNQKEPDNPLGKGSDAHQAAVLRDLAAKIHDGTATFQETELFRQAADLWAKDTVDPTTQRIIPGNPFTPNVRSALDKLNAPPQPNTPPGSPQPAQPQSGNPANPMQQPPVTETTSTGSVRTMQAPQTTAQGVDDYRKSEVEAGKVRDAINGFKEALQDAGGTGFNTLLNNPMDPKTVRLMTAYRNMTTAMRGESFLNTGVLQPHELKLMDDMLLNPSSVRGAMATMKSYQAMFDELNGFINKGLDRKRAAANIPARPSGQSEAPAIPPPPDGFKVKVVK